MRHEVIADSSLVLGAYCSLELMRSSRAPERMLWIVFFVPYAAVTFIFLAGSMWQLPRLLAA